jgi:Tfp pilus assembly protein PilN
LDELRLEHGGRGGAIAISLLPPLVQVRRIGLPPIGDDEARQVLERGAVRHFLGIREAQAVSATRILRGWRRTGAVIAAATPSRVVTAIVAAAEEAGWRVATIAPAHAAWVVAAQADAPRAVSASAQLVVLRDEGTDLIRIDSGAISAVRYFAQAGTWIEQLADAIVDGGESDGPVPTLAAGGGERRSQLVAALRARGIVVAGGESGPDPIGESPEATAAAFAFAARRFDLLPPQVHVARQRAARGATMVVTGVAAAALIVAAWAQLWGLRREVAAVQEQRTRIKSGIGQVIEARRVIEDIERRLGALAPYEAEATRWSAVLATVATRLPRDAYLTSLAGTGDTVIVEGSALQAAGVFRALQRAPGIDSVGASEIRRDVSETGASTERFTMAAVLSRPDSTPAPRSIRPGGPPASGPTRGAPRGPRSGGMR